VFWLFKGRILSNQAHGKACQIGLFPKFSDLFNGANATVIELVLFVFSV